MGPAAIAITTASLLAGALAAVTGERRLVSANPLRRLRFHWSTPAHPPVLPPDVKLLQIASTAMLAVGAWSLTQTTFLPWFAAWIGLALVLNVLPRGAVLALHHRRLRGTS